MKYSLVQKDCELLSAAKILLNHKTTYDVECDWISNILGIEVNEAYMCSSNFCKVSKQIWGDEMKNTKFAGPV